MCCPTKKGNCKFPSVDDGFEEYMRQKNCKAKFKNILDDSIDISEVKLHYLLSKNPVAAAEIFKITLETIFEILFGIKPEHYNKVTIPNSSRNKGIFGNTRAAFTVTEIQGRLSLHGHMTVWTSLSPSIIQRSIKCKKLLESVKDVIKSQIASTIPLNYHITSMSRQATTPEERPTDEPRRTYYDSPSPDLNLAGFEDHVHRVVNSTSVHQHSPTCTKGPLGHIGCRLSYPYECTKGSGVSINQLKLIPQKKLIFYNKKNTPNSTKLKIISL